MISFNLNYLLIFYFCHTRRRRHLNLGLLTLYTTKEEVDSFEKGSVRDELNGIETEISSAKEWDKGMARDNTAMFQDIQSAS